MLEEEKETFGLFFICLLTDYTRNMNYEHWSMFSVEINVLMSCLVMEIQLMGCALIAHCMTIHMQPFTVAMNL